MASLTKGLSKFTGISELRHKESDRIKNMELGFKKIGEVPFPGLGVVNKLDCGKSQIKILALEEPPKHENVTGDLSFTKGDGTNQMFFYKLLRMLI